MNPATDATSKNPGFFETLLLLRDIRLWRIFILGFASGYPWAVIGGSTLFLWLRQVGGFSRTEIGFFSLAFLAYTINFLWAPVLDAVKFNWTGKLGQRRSWLLLCQLGIVVLTLLMAAMIPSRETIGLFFVLAIAVGYFSATQDLAIDAYRITIIPREETGLVSLAAAMATCGWWVGFGLTSALMLYLTDIIAWNYVYVLTALMLVPVSLLVLAWFEEPPKPLNPVSRRWYLTVVMEYVDTVSDFFKRNGVEIAFSLLLFILLFKIGEAFLGRMVGLFYTDIGYTNTEIATYSKLISTGITIVFSIFAGALMPRMGVFKMLFFAGIAMAATNLMFVWIAVVGPDLNLFLAAVVSDGITSSISTVAFVAFITFLCESHSCCWSVRSVGFTGKCRTDGNSCL